MSSEEAKKIINAGLERRKEEQRIAEKEAQLEAYEQEQIRICNEHCADVKQLRLHEETGRLHRQQQEARRAERALALANEQAREEAAHNAVRRFCYSCLGIAMVTTWTPLEWWAAAALIAGLAVFPMAYIFRLYYPIEGIQ